jgi:toxin ParE1/3/4
MVEIIWSKSSVNDLKNLYRYISKDSALYAKRFVEFLISRVDQLKDFPESGRVVPEKNNPKIRELIEGNYRIFYQRNSKRIIILRIHNSSKNIQ